MFHFALIGCPNFDVSMVYSWLRTWIINSDGIEKRYFPFQRVTFSVVIVICSTYQIVLFDLDEIITWLYWCCFKWKVWNKLHFENIYHSNFKKSPQIKNWRHTLITLIGKTTSIIIVSFYFSFNRWDMPANIWWRPFPV